MQTRAQKEEIVKNLAKAFNNSKGVVFSDFKGLKVKDMALLRRELKSEGANMNVVKKTLIDIALKEAGIGAGVSDLEGQIAVAVSGKDEVAAARIIAKAAKANENLKIVGGLLGDKNLSREEVLALSKLPSKEDLLAKLANVLNAPISGLANVLAGNLRGLLTALKAISESKS